MSETPASSETAPTEKPPRRLHWTTQLLALLWTLLATCAICGHELHPDSRDAEYGWPFVFAKSDEDSIFIWTKLWSLNPFVSFSALWLLADIACFVALLYGISILWERRLAKRMAWHQFALSDWLWFCVLFAAGYAGLRHLYHDRLAQWRFDAIQLKHHTKVSRPPLIGYDCDCPWDWFWETAHIPESWRPYRRFTIEISFGNEDVDNELRQVALGYVGELHALRSTYFSAPQYGDDEPPQPFIPLDWNVVAKGCPCISSLGIVGYDPDMMDESLQPFTELRELQSLSVTGAPKLRGHILRTFSRLTSLELRECGLDEEGFNAIGQLSNLRGLEVRYENTVSIPSWTHLGKLQQLKVLKLRDCELDEEGFKALGELSSLRELELRFYNPIPIHCWRHLGKLQQLEVLAAYSQDLDDERVMSFIPKLGNLKYLDLYERHLSQETLKAIPPRRKILRP